MSWHVDFCKFRRTVPWAGGSLGRGNFFWRKNSWRGVGNPEGFSRRDNSYLPGLGRMSQRKKEARRQFRETVFSRDGHKCRVCGAEGVELDAHHITPREILPNGGYVMENGVSLCATCHVSAEAWLQEPGSVPGRFSPSRLYNIIGSSENVARQASERLP